MKAFDNASRNTQSIADMEKLDTDASNPLEKAKHQESQQNFRIRDNMRAGFGICFREN